MKEFEMTDLELYERGIQFLLEELGPVEMPHFLQQCKPRKTDYTAERHKLLDNDPDIPTLAKHSRREEAARKVEEQAKTQRIAAWRKNLIELTDSEIFEVGFKILLEKLGHAGTIGFCLHHFEHGNHDDAADVAQHLPEAELVSRPRQQAPVTAPNP